MGDKNEPLKHVEQKFNILELNYFVGEDKILKKNIINSCNMFCGKYYINMKTTMKKYLGKKTNNKEIFVAVKKKDCKGIDKINNILGYCILTYRKERGNCLVNIQRNNKSIGYRYVSIKKAREMLGNNFSCKKETQNLARLNVICALTPDKIPILPEFSCKNFISYIKNYINYKKEREKYQLEDRTNKIPKLGTYFLEGILDILKQKKVDIVKLGSLDLNNRDTRNRFCMINDLSNISINYQT